MSMTIQTNINRIRGQIAEAALRVGRKPEDILLMAVTKSVGDPQIMEAIAAGVDILGDNYIQEARRKIGRMEKTIPWHFIGHLQTNKAKYAVQIFDMVQTVDRFELAEELDRHAHGAGLTVPILIEVSIAGEETKSGVSIAEAPALIRRIALIGGLKIKGLMAMPPWFDDPKRARPFFRILRELRDRLIEENIAGIEMKELSMGMSEDFEVAVEEGATVVRIGRAIFGEREQTK
jgi:pyridoxal phosphate enzyme (YggS family)